MSRLRGVVICLIIFNVLGAKLFGVEFLYLGWLLNLPCGIYHYYWIEEGEVHGSFVGTVCICAIPWAQTLLTAIVVGLGTAWIVAWRIQQWWKGD